MVAPNRFGVNQPRQVTLVVESDAAVSALVLSLDYDIDKWGDWGREGAPFVRVARRILDEIHEQLPKAWEAGQPAPFVWKA